MAKENTAESCDILFEYLRSILYDAEIQQPDFGQLDAAFEDLGAGLRVLQKYVEEMKAYSESLSNGELSGEYPSRDNFLCANLKNLHANLNHLTWQAKRVAAGDYSQHVSYLGEFSVAFNTMIRQLKVREEGLRDQIDKTQRQMAIIEQYNELFSDMMNRRNVWFVVIEAGTGEICYCNRHLSEVDETEYTDCGTCSDVRCKIRDVLRSYSDSSYRTWEWGDERNGYFQINSLPVEWRGKNAIAHVVEDITEEKREEDRLTSRAYYDAGTGIHNRFFFEEYLEGLLHQHTNMVLCFMDLDGLKYTNDHFGHNEGDVYIRRFVREILSSFRATDTFARIGGDEFCLLLPNADPERIHAKLEQVRAHFISSNPAVYPTSFSYGLVQVDGSAEELTTAEIIEEADRRMYEYKKKYKPGSVLKEEAGSGQQTAVEPEGASL